MRRFIIATNGFSKQHDSEFVEWCRNEKVGWWHRISDFWLLTNRREDAEITATSIRDKLKSINDDCDCLVMEIPEDITWSAYKGGGNAADFTKWLTTTWVK